MPKDTDTAHKASKGERTMRRILDAAEDLFARHGYDGTSLRSTTTLQENRRSTRPCYTVP